MPSARWFDGAQVTFPKLLQRAGYQTAIVGKWHLDSEPTGFDFWQILIDQGVYYNPPMNRMGEQIKVPGYTTDIITDISLFRPGPVKSDMITPYLEAKQGWGMPSYLHEDLRPILGETRGVVVFHEQVIEIIAQLAGCSLAEADEARRALGVKCLLRMGL